MKTNFLIILSVIILFGKSKANNTIMTVKKDANNFAVELDKMNVLYMGLDNPVTISYSGSAKVIIRITNGTVTPNQEKGKYIVKVYSGNEAILSLYKLRGGKEILVGEKKYRIKRIPDPIAMACGMKEGSVKKATLLAAPFVIAKYENFDFDMKINVYSFVVTVNVAGEFKSYLYYGNQLSIEQLSMIERLKNNARVIFEDIKCKMPDGTTRILNPVNLKVQT